MAKCDLFIMPSYTEGFLNTILESMALGTPIIATTVGAIPEMLARDCGLLVPTRDVEALKSAILLLMQVESLMNKYRYRAQQKVQQEYYIDVIFPHYVHVWKSLATV